MSDIRLRFFFGKSGSFARRTKRTVNEAAGVIFRDVAFSYADNLYNNLVKKIQKRIEKDISFEIAHIARLYRNLIIDAPKTKNTPASPSQLYPAASGFDGGSMPLRIPGGRWSPRDPDYVNRKKREGYSQGWWKRTGIMGAVLGTGKGWQGVFGDRIEVKVRRISSESRAETKRPFYRNFGPTEMRIGVANIEVTALEKLNLGDLRGSMISAAYAYSPGLGGRLNQMAYQTGERRVTLEPFINFVITKSFPHAIKRRLETGLVGATRNLSLDQPRLRR